ncbi:hypothetical protein GCM10009573_29540 [Agromyces bracchium]
MQATRIDIMTVYLIMRARRSSSGDGGSDVIDCRGGCFMVVAVDCGAPHLKPTSAAGDGCRALGNLYAGTGRAPLSRTLPAEHAGIRASADTAPQRDGVPP